MIAEPSPIPTAPIPPAPDRGKFTSHFISRYGHLAISAALASGLVIAADVYFSRSHSGSASAQWSLRRPGYGPASFGAALAASDTRIDGARTMLRIHPDDWMREEGLARGLVARFRLTGNYADLAEASSAMARGRALAPDPAGPILSDAELGMAAHRLEQTDRALAALARWAVPPDRGERAEAAALAGDLAFYRGDMAGARRGYAQAAAIDGGGSAYRTAILAKAQGDFDGAVRGFRTYLAEQRSPSPFQVANVAMQVGAVELARGNAEEALRRFQEADRTFPGYWLVQAHLAQGKALAGDPAAAIAAMRAVAQSSQSAEAMDALAMLLRTFGHAAESRQWATRAGEVWRRRIEQAPEAAYGHAAEHEIVFGTPERALDLAQRNLAGRPYGESRLLLANALVLNGRIAEALVQLQQAEASGWRSAPLYALRVEAFALAGRQAEAERARTQAQALNPNIFEPATALVWFSHG
jgi:tetratricopeptide (TPR) repeat protein